MGFLLVSDRLIKLLWLVIFLINIENVWICYFWIGSYLGIMYFNINIWSFFVSCIGFYLGYVWIKS